MIEPKLIYHLTDAEYHRRMAKAWREGYAAGWKDQECDFPPHHRKPISGDQMTNTEKTIICTVITCMLIIFLTIGTCISMQWYTSTHHDFRMETVKTGDVTWACLKDRGAYIGCNTVEEYK